MRILTNNLCSDSATVVTASSSSSLFPVSNLKHQFRSKRWRSTDVTSEWVKFDMLTSEPVDSVVILWPKEDGIKLSDSAVVKVQANATNVWTSPAVDETLTIDNTYSIASHYFTSDQSYRYWRVVVEDPGNPWGYLELGVVWIGKSLSIQNAQNGFSYRLLDRSKVTTTDFGHQYVDEYPQSAQLELNYAYLDYDDVQELENAYRVNGNRLPVFVTIDESETALDKNHFAIYGKFASSFGLGHVNYNLFNADGVTIEELS